MNKLFLTLLGLMAYCSVVLAAPWDVLREPIAEVGKLSPIFIWVLFIVSVVLLFISIKAMNKKKSERLAWVTAAFGVFSIKAFLIMADMYLSPGNFMNSSIQAFFDLVIMVSLFVALFRK
jgi:ABC-type Co2+ transport system permease subunit